MSKDTKQVLIVENNGDEFIIEIPVDCKLTYGPVAVGQGAMRNGGGSMALRIYESEKKQLAIFTGVKQFRDLSLPVWRKNVKVTQEEQFDYDNRGNRYVVQDRQTEEVWEDMNEEYALQA